MVNNALKMLVVLYISVGVLTAAVQAAPPPPSDGKATQQNLKFTFGSKDDIPAAFFESPPLQTRNTTTTERRVYPACQDGSGGMCVDVGTCPSDKKPVTSAPGACAKGQECCFGAPTNDRTCASRGGECRATAACGSAPKFLEAVDCDKKNGQVCCILV